MATVSNWAKGAEGHVGDVTIVNRNGKSYMRTARNNRTRKGRTPDSMRVRTRISNYTTFWREAKNLLQGHFEVGPGQTQMSRFLSLNARQARVYLTREEAAARACVLDQFWVAHGSLPPVHVHEEEGWLVSDLPWDWVPRYHFGDILQLIVAEQIEQDGVPSVRLSYDTCHFIDTPEPDPNQPYLSDKGKPFNEMHLRNGFLAYPKRDGVMATWVHVRRAGNRYLLSPSQLTGSNPLLQRYTTDEALQRAIDSYGGEDQPKDVAKHVEKTTAQLPIDKLSDRQQLIVGLVATQPEITIQQMSQKLKVTTRTVDRDLKALVEQGLVRRQGGRKEGRWEVAKS